MSRSIRRALPSLSIARTLRRCRVGARMAESWRNRKTLILSWSDMVGLLTPAEYVDRVEHAFRMHGLGRVYMEPKGHIVLDKYKGEWEVMPSYIEEPEAAACKWVSIREDNAEYELPAVFSILIYTHPETGFPLAICDGSYHTLMRTGASAAVSAKWLARPDSKVLAILGSGLVGRGNARDLRHGVRVGGRAALEPDAGVGRPLPRGGGAEVPAPDDQGHDGRRGGRARGRRDRDGHARAAVAGRRRVGEAGRAHRRARRRPEGRAGARPADPPARPRLRRRHPPVPRGRRDQRASVARGCSRRTTWRARSAR